MNVAFAIILFIFVLVFYSFHLLLYYSGIKLFLIEDIGIKTWLFYGFSLMAIGFFVMSFITRYSESIIVRGLYYITSVWAGLALNLLMAAGIGWLIYWLLKLAGSNFSFRLVALWLLILAIGLTAFGLINARRIKLIHHNIVIDNLPEAWSGRIAVHLTDTHFGAINRPNFGEKMIKIINSVNPDIVFITGDYFDGTVVNFAPLAEPLKKLDPPLGTYFISGNHETYIGDGNLESILNSVSVKWLHDEAIEIDGLKIIGIDYPAPGERKNEVEILKTLKTNDQPTILLFHEPRFIKKFKDLGIDLLLSGHTHAGQQFPINLITRAIYGKYHYGFHSDNGFNVNTSAGAGTWGPPIRTGHRPDIGVIIFK
jgi:predicted MPP superfamily phosphohydrolase